MQETHTINKDGRSFIGPVKMKLLSTDVYSLKDTEKLKAFVQQLASGISFILEHTAEKAKKVPLYDGSRRSKRKRSGSGSPSLRELRPKSANHINNKITYAYEC